MPSTYLLKYRKFTTKQNCNQDGPKVVLDTVIIKQFTVPVQLIQLNSTNFLSLKIDDYLSWDSRVKHVLKK